MYNNHKNRNIISYIKFLGTGGTRFVVSKQLCASGGIWCCFRGLHIHIDPGPGALLQALQTRYVTDPKQLTCIILSHRHIDHSNDVNIMIEAMTEGGTQPRGVLFCPQDTIDNDPIVFNYIRNYITDIKMLAENMRYNVDELEFDVPVKHIHGNVETYGMRFITPDGVISYIADTRFFDKLKYVYHADILIMNVVLKNRIYYVDHLCVDDAIVLIRAISPSLAVLTHFGLSMLKANPQIIAEKITDITGIRTIAAFDGMMLDIISKDIVSQAIEA
jgi:phosphoribosyl 1,2-cyclic phosphodiesterase